MNQFFSIFNTREQALIFWISIVVLFFLIKTRFSGIKSLAKAFFNRKVFGALVICWVYLSIIIFSANKLGWWNQSMLKDSVIWMLAVVGMLMKAVGKNARNSIVEILKDSVQPIIFVEFIVNVGTLPLIWEILLVPLSILLFTGMLSGQRNLEHKILVKPFNFLLSVLGWYLIIYSIYYVIVNFNSLDKHQQGLDFFLPIWLTITFTPGLYLIGLYSRYEEAFVTVNSRVARHSKEAARYFKRQLLLKSRLSISKIDYYHKKMRGFLIDSKSAVDNFFLTYEDSDIPTDKNIESNTFILLQYLLDYEYSEAHRTIEALTSNISLDEKFIKDTIFIFSQKGYVESDETLENITYRLTDSGRFIVRIRRNFMWYILRFFI